MRRAVLGAFSRHSGTFSNFSRAFERSLLGFQPRFFSSTSEEIRYVLVERIKDSRVAVVRLNRPKALNALCDDLVNQMNEEMTLLDKDESVGCIVLTGSEKAFAAGADLKEMSSRPDYATVMEQGMLESWENLTQIKTPIIAAVSGYALGGGCELAMMCDIIIASADAQFGQPEVAVGTIPGCGGTQRLVRAVGKSKAMQWILTGERFSAEEAEKAGLISKVVKKEELMGEALKMAEKIASFSRPISRLAKTCVNSAFETSLREGVNLEKRLFHGSWGLNDRTEGMKAFVEKRSPKWTNS